jgi:hypothetical protein
LDAVSSSWQPMRASSTRAPRWIPSICGASFSRRRRSFVAAVWANSTANARCRRIAEHKGVDADAIEEALYADLPTAHLLRKADLPSPTDSWRNTTSPQHQAVLLRAVRLQARVFCAAPAPTARFFATLKFHRLLYSIAKLDRGGLRHPYRRPLQLVRADDEVWRAICAGLACHHGMRRLGSQRRATLGQGSSSLALPRAWPILRAARRRRTVFGRSHGTFAHGVGPARLPIGMSPWPTRFSICPASACAFPTWCSSSEKRRRSVFLEVLGFWSRDAVWKRIELAQAGLPHPIVFAVSRHLRVSEEASPTRRPRPSTFTPAP